MDDARQAHAFGARTRGGPRGDSNC